MNLTYITVNSIYDYIIKPIGERYNNSKKVGNKNLILNTKIETFKAVNKKAKIIAVPKAYNLPIKKGDIVYVHHNIFRKFYNMKGQFHEKFADMNPRYPQTRYANAINTAFQKKRFTYDMKEKYQIKTNAQFNNFMSLELDYPMFEESSLTPRKI